MMNDLTASDPPPSDAAGDDQSRPLTIASAELFQGRREILISHREQLYRLRITNAGKLILTK